MFFLSLKSFKIFKANPLYRPPKFLKNGRFCSSKKIQYTVSFLSDKTQTSVFKHFKIS